MEMKTRDMIAVALMCIGSWCAYHAYALYHTLPAKAFRAVAQMRHALISKTDSAVLAYAISGAILIVVSFMIFGERKKRG